MWVFSFSEQPANYPTLVLATTNEYSLAIFNDVFLLKINIKDLKYMYIFEAGSV